MSESLITEVWKRPKPIPPGYTEGTPPQTAVVGGVDSVPIELHFRGDPQAEKAGVDIIFLIDNSGSMGNNDPDGERYKSLLGLIAEFQAERDQVDRIAIVTFAGDNAALVQGWRNWSDTQPTVLNLLEQGSGGGTPMAHGMSLANAQLAATDGFFKMVILLSDGAPTPDDYTTTPVETILGELNGDAFGGRILFSTIYLTTQEPPDDSALLWEIARATDYISEYTSPTDPPAYYFRITDANQIAERYRTLFRDVDDRAVPLSVILREQVSDKLLIDPDAEVVFSGNGFQEDQNILGFGDAAAAAGVSTLDGALALFRQTRVFEIHLNELDDDASLKFSVRLNLDGINPDDYPGDRVCVDVDVNPGSYLSYLRPTGGVGSSRVTLALPQARVCFKKGLAARKIYEPSVTDNLVQIEFCNLDLDPVKWVELAEYPSGFLDASHVDDDFEFKPFRMLLRNRLIPWLLQLVEGTLKRRFPQYETLPRRVRRQLRQGAIAAMVRAYEPLLDEETLFDPYLCQFMFAENPPESSDLDLDAYWRTVNQRGIYKLILDFPPVSTKQLQFRIQDASHLISAGADCLLEWYVDALYPKHDITHTMSWYRAEGMASEEMLTPNPLHTQQASSTIKPDLFAATCFMSEDAAKLRQLFTGSPSLSSPWNMLNSVGIQPIWEGQGQTVGVSVRVYNCGGQAAGSRLRARSYFVPFTGDECVVNLQQQRIRFHPSPPFRATGTCEIDDVAPDSTDTVEIYYDHFSYLGMPRDPVEPGFLSCVRNAVVITMVDISPAEGEVMLSNNKGIEIVPLTVG